MNGIPSDAAVELSDGTVVKPDDQITLKELYEIIPLILETMQASAAAAPGAPNAPAGRISPGSPVPIRGGGPAGFNSPVASGFGNKPGSIAPAAGFGQQGGGGGGGGGGFGGGGGGRGGPGPQGLPGPQGPPGSGSILGGQFKTSGSFTVAGAPQVIPNYFADFTVTKKGNVVIRASANFNRSLGSTFPQITFGLRIGTTDYVLGLFQEQQGAGQDKVFDHHMMVELFIENMDPGTYQVRGIYSGGFPGAEMTFVAAPDMPAMLAVQGP